MNKQKFLLILLTLVVTGLLFADPPQWNPMIGNQYNMQLYAEVTLYEQPFENDPGNIIAAFGPGGEDDCRAIGFWDEVGQYPNNYAMWYFTIRSNASANDMETINFMIYDTQSDQVYECLGEFQIYFEDNSIIGSIYDPYQLTAPANLPPVSLQDNYVISEDENLVVDVDSGVLVNDYDPEGSILSASLIDGTQHGELMFNQNGSFEYSPNENYFGTDQFSYQAYDGELYGEITSVDIEVLPVNDSPVFSFPPLGFEFEEDSDLITDFAQYVSDPEGDDITQLSVIHSENISVMIIGFVVQFTAETDWYGSEYITFEAVDQFNAVSSDSVLVNVIPVNDSPQIDIPYDQFNMQEDQQQTLNLDQFISDIDNEIEDITLEVFDNDNIDILVDGFSVILIPDQDWFGSEVLNFVVSDNVTRLQDNDFVEIIVEPVNDAPIIDIPQDDYYFNEDEYLILDISDYITDVDDDELDIQYMGNSYLNFQIVSPAVFNISAPENWSGSELITFTVSDSAGLTDTDQVTINVVPVPDSPVINLPDSFVVDEDSTLVVDFGAQGYVYDVDSDSLNLIAQSVNVQVNISGLLVEFVPALNWNGIEIIHFSVYDETLMASDEVEFIVNPVNDPPVIDIEDSYTFHEDQELLVDFSQYITDIDLDTITLTVEGNQNVLVDINQLIVTFSSIQDWFGSETLTFFANDNQGRAIASDVTEVIVLPENDEPVVNLPSNISFNEDETYLIDFSPYISDDSDSLWLSVSGNQNISVDIEQLNVSFIPNYNWYGSEVMTFSVYDGEFTVNDIVNVTVIPVNDPPQINVPNEFVFSPESSYNVNFINYVFDLDGDDLSLFVEGNQNVDIVIDGLLVTFNTSDWLGVERVTFTVDDGVNRAISTDEVDLVITDDTQMPVIYLPETFIFNEDGSLNSDFNQFIYNESNLQVSLSATGYQNVIVDIDSLNNHVVFSAVQNWFGQEEITFTITVSGYPGYFSSDVSTVIVNPINDPPVINLPVEGFSFLEDGSLTVNFNLGSGYISDVDSDSVFINLDANAQYPDIDLTFIDNIATFTTVEPDWWGSEDFTISVNDGMIYLEEVFTVNVIPVNDTPSINLPEEGFSFPENSILPVDFSQYIEDIDQDELLITLVNETDFIYAEINQTMVSFSALEYWNGSEALVFSANDLQGRAIDIDTVMVFVTPVNNPPYVENPIPDIEIMENSYDESIDLNQVFADYDLDPLLNETITDSLIFSYLEPGDNNFNISVTNGIVSIAPDQNWYGEKTILFYAIDTGGLEVADSTLVTVISVNYPPEVVQDIPDFGKLEDFADFTLDLDDYFYDQDGDVILYSVQYDVAQVNAQVIGSILTISSLENWFGQAGLIVTATDPDSLFATDGFVINVAPVNDPPQIELPEQFDLTEDIIFSVNFDEYACDCDNDEVIIFHDATQNLEITYNDSIPTLVYMNGIENWFGAETVTFYVSDQTGRLTDSDDVVINVAPVNDPPLIDVPDTGFTFAEDNILDVDFTPYISDIDSENLTIIISEGDHVQAVIEDYQVTFTADENWFGTEQHTFTVGDGEFYASEVAPVIVTPVNDDPSINLPIAFNTTEDNFLEVDFSEYISDIDNLMDDISLNLIGNYPDVDVNIDVMMVTFTPVPDFNGTVNIGFLVDDSAGGTASDYVDLIIAPVNDAPTIELPDSFTFNEDENLVIDFEPYIDDIDNDVLTLSSINPENVNIAIDEFMVTFTASQHWNGTESVTFIISDESGRATDSDDVDVIVIPVNDAPVINLPPEFRFNEDNFHERDFTSYISDIDTPLDELALQVSGNTNVEVIIDGFDVMLSATENWSGSELLTFTVYETTMRLQDSDDVMVIVNPVNDPPVIQLPVSVNINEGGSTILDMTDFVSDVDNDYSELTLEADSTEYVTIQIDGFNVTLSALTDWNGTEIVNFTVQDTVASVSDNMRVNILPVNDPPVIDLPEEFSLLEDNILNLDFVQYVSDVDQDQLSLSVAGNQNIQVEINSLNVSIRGNENWYGQEMLYFTVDDNVTRLTDTDSTLIIVQPLNDAPQITLPSQFDIQEDLPFTVDFTQYVTDVDQDSLLLTVSGNNNIQVTIDSLSVTLLGNENWYGQEIIQFTVQDPDSLFDIDNVVIHVDPVNDSPTIELPDQFSLLEDNPQQIDFSEFASDVDQDILSLSVEGNTNIQVVINGLIVSMFADNNWFGQETLYFTVDDNINRLTASDSVLVIIEPVNDPPILTLPDSIDVLEGGFYQLDLTSSIVDIDNDYSELTVSSPGTEHLQIDVNGVILTISAFSDWYGIENLQITVADSEFSTSDFMQVNILPTNDFPVIDLPDTLTTLEDVPLTIDVSEYANDVDEDQLTLTISGNTDINVEIDGLAVTLYGNTNWFGQEILHFTVDDNINRLTASDSVLVIIEPVNDPPVINLPASIIAVQDTLETFDFSEFIFDVEGDPLTLSYTGNDFIDSIYVDGLSITIIDSLWMTTENVLFEVTDGEYTSSDVVNITLIPTGEVPGTGDIVITLPNLDGLEPGEDFEFPVNVNILLEAWEIYGFNFNLLFDPTILEFLGWNFENTIVDSSRFDIRDTSVSYTQEDPISGTGSLINIEFKYISTEYEQDVVELDEFEFTAPEPVIPIVFDGVVNNDYPTLALPLSNQSLQEDFATVEVNLRDFFFDNTPNSLLEFSVSSASQDFAVAIDQDMMNIVSIQDRYTDQTIPVTVVCWDKFLYSVRDTFLVTVDPVNDPPVIVGLEDFQLEPDQQLPVDFNDYIFDVDNDVLSEVTIEVLNLTSPVDPDIDLVYSPGPLDKSATFTAPHNWTGLNNYQIIAYDTVDSDSANFNVNVVYTGGNDIHCYPNPMTTDLGTRFVINSTTNINNVSIDIYDFSGKKVCSQTFQSRGANEITWMGYTKGWNGSKNGTKLARGVYFARVVGKDDYGEIALEKVIKVAIKE